MVYKSREKERETLLLRAAPRAANRSSGTQQANTQPSPRRRGGPSSRPPAPRRAPPPALQPPPPAGPSRPPPTRRSPPGQGHPSAEPGPWGGGGRRQCRDSGWQRCRAPPGGAGRGGVRCPRAGRRGPAWRAEEARRGGAGQAAEPGLPEGLAGPFRSARAAAAAESEREPPPLGAAPDGAPPPAPWEQPPPASPVPGGRGPAQPYRGEGKRGVPLGRHGLPCPDLQSQRGPGRPREDPWRAGFLSPQPLLPSGTRSWSFPPAHRRGTTCRPAPSRPPRVRDAVPLLSRSLPLDPSMRRGLFSGSFPPAVRKERESTALAGHGPSVPGSHPLLPASPVRDRGCRPLWAPAAVAPARPRRPPHLGPAAGSSLSELSLRCGGRRGELPQPHEQRLLRPRGLSRRGP
ncbi:proline-rich protein 2-like [Corvus kubaryi]|uniref:proline-rich protein 2-like n=1 Tax=Corvus kubaryi TaxID=68294 RepID=UPI001C044C39|nr:proline-rich protein 2-like [Corvus kubaryi]